MIAQNSTSAAMENFVVQVAVPKVCAPVNGQDTACLALSHTLSFTC